MSRNPPANLKGIRLPRAAGRKRRSILTALRDHLAANRLAPGTRIPSAHTLMRQFRVSYVTMHSALGDLVREGLLIRHQGKGTFVADRPACGRRPLHSRLALVLPPEADIWTSYNGDSVLRTLYGCNQGARQCDADLSVVTIPSSPLRGSEVRRAIERVQRYDGAIFIGLEFREVIESLRRRLPLVVISERSAPDSHVDYDQREGIRLAVAHLRKHGYRRVAYFGALAGLAGMKFQYFGGFLRSEGCTLGPEQAWDCPDVSRARAVAQQFVRQCDGVEAVFVDNYHKAEILVREAQSAGVRIPGDLALLAYHVEPVSSTIPPLSMVAIPLAEMGAEATRLLDQLIRGEIVPPAIRILKPRLLARDSCGCAPAPDRPARLEPETAETIAF